MATHGLSASILLGTPLRGHDLLSITVKFNSSLSQNCEALEEANTWVLEQILGLIEGVGITAIMSN
jgi:hypothetical protein